ncbi:hypothetical protein ElyMa_005164400 [Elysia marginata]|uniref:Uncharacterized protein n=1 Tax=Elysia marginata TaxID=1093978 RepID=A0AAV4JQZ5_9GAST|nr:hypothetical protein ElyMa_005164400 [Elysia marginata]
MYGRVPSTTPLNKSSTATTGRPSTGSKMTVKTEPINSATAGKKNHTFSQRQPHLEWSTAVLSLHRKTARKDTNQRGIAITRPGKKEKKNSKKPKAGLFGYNISKV